MIRMGRTEGDLAVCRPVPFAGWGACEHGMNGRSGKGVNWRSIGFCCRKVCYSDDNWKTTAKEQATQGVEQARLRHTLRADGGLCASTGADRLRTVGRFSESRLCELIEVDSPTCVHGSARNRSTCVSASHPGGIRFSCSYRERNRPTNLSDTLASQSLAIQQGEEPMVAHVDVDIAQVWREYKDAKSKPVELRNQLVEHYLPLVKYNAERIWARLPDGVDLDDLISAGIFGLMDAIEAFDLDRGVKFETYCVPRIRGAMLDELRTMDWVPRLVRSKASKLEDTRKRLEAELGRPPSPEEMADRLGVTLEEYYKQLGDATAISQVSLNKKWYETDSYKDVREIDILEDKKAEDPTHRIQNRDLMRLVTRGLNRNERLIIILYYYEDMTMKEIGATLDLSESRVSQMHSSIVARLQSQLAQRRPEFST